MVSTLQKLLRSTSLNSDDPNPPSQPRLSEAGSANLLKQSSLPSRGSFNDFSVGCGEDAQEADNGRGVAIPQAQKAHYNPFAAAVSTEQQRKPLKHQGKRIDGLDHYEWVQLVSPGSL
eukprot:jgi/Astpho2/6006/Aster-03963